jgi:hypothetical protein
MCQARSLHILVWGWETDDETIQKIKDMAITLCETDTEKKGMYRKGKVGCSIERKWVK